MTGERKLLLNGLEHHYLCIDLRDGNNSQLLVPIDSLESSGVREATCNISFVNEVMFSEPHNLDDDYRTRQTNILGYIKDDDAEQLVQGLRDLCWREHCSGLTTTDKKLRTQLQKRLSHELAVAHDYSRDVARQKLNQIIEQAIAKHAAAQSVD